MAFCLRVHDKWKTVGHVFEKKKLDDTIDGHHCAVGNESIKIHREEWRSRGRSQYIVSNIAILN